MVNKQVQYEFIERNIGTVAGRARLAGSLIQPLRKRRDYLSVGRKGFYVESLPNGALPIYDKDPNVTAYVVGDEGENIISITKSKRVHFPTFTIASNPEVPLEEIIQRRFDLVTRAVDLGKSEIMAEEDRKVFACLNALAADPTNPNPTIPVTGNLTANALADAFGLVQRTDVRVALVFMNARDYTDLLKWDRDTLDIETQGILLKTGLMATLWGAKIMCSRIVTEGTVYVLGEAEFLGRIPERIPLTVLSADEPRLRLIGFSMLEVLGIGAYNPYALSTLSITRV